MTPIRYAFLALLTLLAATALPAQPVGGTRILAGYGGVRINDAKEGWRDYLPLLAQAGFNTVDFKFLPGNFKMNDPAVDAEIAAVANSVAAAGLKLSIYLYSTDGGKRDPKHPAGPAFVGPDGKTDEHRYCLYQPRTWMYLYQHVFYLAEKSRVLPISAVKMDMEIITNETPCVCDDCFAGFAAAHGGKVADIPPAKRWAWIKAHGGVAAYRDHLEQRLNKCAQQFEQRVHAINPKLRLGYMPYVDDYFHRPWTRFLATAEAPAIIDSWPMYSGLGYTATVATENTIVHQLNPRNLYVPWFRINTYRPADIAAEAVVAATKTDGYNMWTISMINPQVVKEKLPEMYALPKAFPDPMAYWAQLKQANARIKAWLKDPTVNVPHLVIEPLIATVDLAGVKAPALKPIETTQADPQPPAPPTGLRGLNRLFLYVADPAQPLRFTITHLAGKQRPHPISYGLVDEAGTVIDQGLVQPGEKKQFSERVKRAGAYVLLIRATSGGGPWYSVKVPQAPYVVDTSHTAYFFRRAPRQYFLVPAGTTRFSIHYGTGGQGEEGALQVYTPDGAKVLDEIVTSRDGRGKTFSLPVPAGAAGKVWSLTIGKPKVLLSAADYSENYYLKLQGVPPYTADRPGALLH